MLDPRLILDDLDAVRVSLARRSAGAAGSLGPIAEIGTRRRQLIAEVESLQAERNAANQAMARLAKSSDRAAFEAERDKLRSVAEQIKALDAQLTQVEQELTERLLAVPNLPHESTPDGSSEADNPELRTWGEKPVFDFEPKPHYELGEALGLLDFKRASELSGPRFSVLWGLGAKLARALVRYMLDLHTERHGYLEVAPPYLVKAEALVGTGQLPKFEADLFKTSRHASPVKEGEGSGKDNPEVDTSALYLIPTAEVPLTNLHAGDILDGTKLPLAYTAYTPCFRSEAGSYGKDVRGLIRQHQFDKVELVRFVKPEDGPPELEALTAHAEAVLQGLGLHYRVSALCAGDLGFAAQKTYDLEVWLPGQDAYREISSCSWFGDYQARRAKIRFRPGAGENAASEKGKEKPRLVHTLNGSGLAVGRTLVAILEQYQQADGSVRVPEALVPYVGVERLGGR